MSENLLNPKAESESVNPDEVVILNAGPMEVYAWSRDITLGYQGKEYSLTQRYDPEEGNEFTWDNEELDLDAILDDAALEIDDLAAGWREDNGLSR